MPNRIPCQFFLIRYVPNVVREEFVNIGVILRHAPTSKDADKAVGVQFARSWERLLRLDPDADTELLDRLKIDLTRSVSEVTYEHGSSFETFLAVMQDSFSNSIQLSVPRTSLAEDLISELDRLSSVYIDD